MYRNKYTLIKKVSYKLGAAPVLAGAKRLLFPFRVRSFEKRLAAWRDCVEAAKRETGRSPLFNHVEIETINRCNGTCGFCPVNSTRGQRPLAKMPDELFESILRQLAELEYSGEVCLYSNNESLLDERIEGFVERARRTLPRARILLSTNGTLLTPERYRALVDNVNEFYVNNYCEDFALTLEHRAILDLSRSRPDWWEKTHVVVRYSREVMTNRGGQAPNRGKRLTPSLACGCPYPASQLVIRPDGKVSLCCNDALGTVTMGDLSREGVAEVWWSPGYEDVREGVLRSRGELPLCRHCDTLSD